MERTVFPNETHTMNRQEVMSLLTQSRAVPHPQYSKPGKTLYYSGDRNTWYMVIASRGAYIVEYYSGCPCNK